MAEAQSRQIAHGSVAQKSTSRGSQTGGPVLGVQFNRNHQSGDQGEPANPKLWHAITSMARARFAKYPSPAAAHWVHTQYVEKGGQFLPPHKKGKSKDRKGR